MASVVSFMKQRVRDSTSVDSQKACVFSKYLSAVDSGQGLTRSPADLRPVISSGGHAGAVTAPVNERERSMAWCRGVGASRK